MSKYSELVYPDNFQYKPTIIKAYNKHLLNVDKINTLLIGDKLNNKSNAIMVVLLNFAYHFTKK